MSKEKYQYDCLDCDYHDPDVGCVMPSTDRPYACPQGQKSILSELKTECFFQEVLDDLDAKTGYPKRKIGHMRADYDGFRWWNKPFPCNNDICTAEMAHEIDRVYARLISDDAFYNLAAMKRFCNAHSDAADRSNCQDEYNFYFEGEYCLFWIRCITRSKDYNLYLHAFTKEMKGEAIVGEEAGSKPTKAQQLGINTLTKEEFENMLVE